jgi:hypothetical protein
MRTRIKLMLPLGNFGTLPRGKFPNLWAIWPYFLGQVASRKKKGGLKQILQGEGKLEPNVFLGELANFLRQMSPKFLDQHGLP